MKKILVAIAFVTFFTSCSHREIYRESVQSGPVIGVSFITRDDFVKYIYTNLHDSRNWQKRSLDADYKRAETYAIYKKYAYVYPDGDFKGDRLLTWIDFVMFAGAFYDVLGKDGYINLPPLGEYSYLRKLFSVLFYNKILSYKEIKYFKGNFPIPEDLVKQKIAVLNGFLDEN